MLAVLAVCQPARADTQQEFQAWTALLATADLTAGPTGPSLWFDVHGRRAEGAATHILRPGIGYRLSPLISLWMGYAWTPVFPAGEKRRDEHRLWQQLTLNHNFDSGLALQSRTRLEQRFSPHGDDIGYRVREFVRAGYTFGAAGVGLVAWDELFVGLRKTNFGAPSGLDQNRAFAGLLWSMPRWGRLELGYLNVYIHRNDDTVAHVVAANLFMALKPGMLRQ